MTHKRRFKGFNYGARTPAPKEAVEQEIPFPPETEDPPTEGEGDESAKDLTTEEEEPSAEADEGGL